MLLGAQLLAVATTLTAAQRLHRAVMQGAKAASGSREQDVFSVLSNRVKVCYLTCCEDKCQAGMSLQA